MDHKTLTSRILYTKDIAWKELKLLQQENFKDFTPEERLKLKTSLLSNEFIQPFYVWENEGVLYCLDGKHRTNVLNELKSEGVNVPDMLPANFIDCNDMQEAARMVLLFSSAYARVTQQGLNDFAELYHLDLPDVFRQISLPDMKFEQLMPVPTDLDGIPKDKPATMKITFADHKQLEEAMPLIDDLLKTKFPGSFSSVSSG